MHGQLIITPQSSVLLERALASGGTNWSLQIKSAEHHYFLLNREGNGDLIMQGAGDAKVGV